MSSSNGVSEGLRVCGTAAHMEGHSNHLDSKAVGKGQQASTVLHKGTILIAKLTTGLHTSQYMVAVL